MPKPIKTILVASVAALLAQLAIAGGGRAVIINGQPLDVRTLAALEMAYRLAIANGSCWYDAVSGLWGRAGGPSAGMIQAGLRLGGALRESASNGNAGVIVNGRRLPWGELQALQGLVGYVRPGRYWLDRAGNAGYEGGPALVNLAAAWRQSQSGGAGGYGGYNGWNRNTPGGNWGGDGNCSYYSHPDGPSVMVGEC
jgi:hypothetical protein